MIEGQQAAISATSVLILAVSSVWAILQIAPSQCRAPEDDVSLMQQSVEVSFLTASSERQTASMVHRDSGTKIVDPWHNSKHFWNDTLPSSHDSPEPTHSSHVPELASTAKNKSFDPYVFVPNDELPPGYRPKEKPVAAYYPKGIISNVFHGKVKWEPVWALHLNMMFALVLLGYPCLLIPIALLGAIGVGLLLSRVEGSEHLEGPPVVPTSQLTPRSARIYAVWCIFCKLVPAVLVLIVPSQLLIVSFYHPQEVYAVMLLVSTTCMFFQGLYQSLLTPFILNKISQNMKLDCADVLAGVNADEQLTLVHWVFFPNYEEDDDILSEAINSVAKSSLARTNICVLLAMEEREAGAIEKGQRLKAKFNDSFKEVLITVHPQNLPNDPPGKASNVAYAFKKLVDHGCDQSNAMLTIADADTEFHELYFEMLTRQYFVTDSQDRHTTLWQSAVMHVKNYHRQPGPVIVGTMFTAMTELSFMADPNAVRFPYSTYSLPCSLASAVRGWDAEWIAEDWHMGIKCFLLTLGKAEVEPVMIPSLNYTPETDTWFGSCFARWSQAKRHSLGFSDMSYYLMMIPLILLYVSTQRDQDDRNLANFWHLVFKGVSRLFRFINTHAIVGFMVAYAALDMVLNLAMLIFMRPYVHIEKFLDSTFYFTRVFGVSWGFFLVCMGLNFGMVYNAVCNRLEKPPGGMFAQSVAKYPVIHCVTVAACLIVCGPFFFLALAMSIWLAAIKVITQRNFEYEVAAKPTKQMRMGGEASSSTA